MTTGFGAEEGGSADPLQAGGSQGSRATQFDQAAVGLAFLDGDLRIVRSNRVITDITGLAPEALFGRRPHTLAPRIAPDVAPYLQSVLDTGRPILDLQVSVETGDGPRTRRCFLVSSYPVIGPDGPSGVFAVINEIAGLPQAEQERRARERQQAAIAMLGMRALETIDLDVVMEEAVQSVADALNVEYAKILELLPDGQALLLRAGVGWKEGLVGSASVSSGTDSQAGYTLVSAGPVIVEDLAREQRFRAPPLLVEHGVVSGMSVIVPGRQRPYGVLGVHCAQSRVFSPDDVNFLQASANLLAAAIERKQLREDLVEAETLRRSDELKSALLRTVSHDLRSPLTTIVATAETLERRSSDPAARQLASLVVSESSRLADLVDKLLDVSVLEAGAVTPRREWCSVEEVIEAALDGLPDAEGGFSLSLPEDLPLICADGAQLERVFANLFENASRFSGGQPVDVGARVHEARILVRVTDRGPGLSQAEHARIFEPFFRRGPPGERHGGSGLGLAIAKGFVEANGGRIWVESEAGGGATFALELPIRATDESGPQ